MALSAANKTPAMNAIKIVGSVVVVAVVAADTTDASNEKCEKIICHRRFATIWMCR